MQQKALFIILKGLSLKQIKATFLERESPTLNSCFRWLLVMPKPDKICTNIVPNFLLESYQIVNKTNAHKTASVLWPAFDQEESSRLITTLILNVNKTVHSKFKYNELRNKIKIYTSISVIIKMSANTRTE